MKYLIAIFVFASVLTILLPQQIFSRKKQYFKNKMISISAPSRSGKNKKIAIMISISEKIFSIIPLSYIYQPNDRLEKLIVLAGMSDEMGVSDYKKIKLLMALMVSLVMCLIFLAEPTTLNFLLIILTWMIIMYVCDKYLETIGKNRLEKIEYEMPQILNNLYILTDSGLNLIPAIEVITEQVDSELARELKVTLEDIKIRGSVEEAFLMLIARCQSSEIKKFVSAILQGLEKGSSGINEIMKGLAEESWQNRKQKSKEMAGKASMKLFIPLLLLVFPALIIFIIMPLVFNLIGAF